LDKSIGVGSNLAKKISTGDKKFFVNLYPLGGEGSGKGTAEEKK